MVNIIIKYLLAALLVALFLFFDSKQPIQSIEDRVFDYTAALNPKQADERIVVVSIDEKSLAALGSWPWSQRQFARLITTLSQGGARSIVNTIPFSETIPDQEGEGLGRLQRYLKEASEEEEGGVDEAQQPSAPLLRRNHLSNLRKILTSGLEPEDEFRQLEQAFLQAGTVIQGMVVKVAEHYIILPPPPPPPYLTRESGADLLRLPLSAPLANKILSIKPVFSGLGQRAAAVGFFLPEQGESGFVRQSRLVLSYNGTALPSLALAVAAKSQGVKLSEVGYENGALQIGPLALGVDSDYFTFLPHYQKSPDLSPFKTLSFSDILAGHFEADIFKDNIVLIGGTAPTLFPEVMLTDTEFLSPVELLGYRISSLLNQDHYRRLFWHSSLKRATYIGVGLFLLWLPTAWGRRFGKVATVVIGLGMVAGHGLLMGFLGVWFPLAGPLLLLLVGSLLLHLLMRGEEKSLPPPVAVGLEESNLRLGLAFQREGRLELAFKKFQGCRLDEAMMKILYPLAAELEQAEKPALALEVWQHMSAFDPAYRDLPARLLQAQSIVDDKTPVKPVSQPPVATSSPFTLDQFQLKEILGQGSVGSVYLGRDPHNLLPVAVKVIPLTEIFETSMLPEASRRFFEILSLSTQLEHPSIIHVQQGGEQFGKAFFSMEYLPAKSLIRYVDKDHLLPTALALQVAVKVAMALDYAHNKGVVHGDLKPSNILYDKQSRETKVTNFALSSLINMAGGRLVSVHPQVVPYHLAPECAAGVAPNACSDIFSLGVLFYRLLTGLAPFNRDELIYSDWDNDLDYTSFKKPSLVNPALPPCLDEVVATALQVDPAKRFQRAVQLAQAIVGCVKSQVDGPLQEEDY
ncbi:MAG: CHASE2 domain-containing protein [Magnetococcales bacterium]|nr:CHASE2 domain-containing protein [Magnetococcales bacterium]